MSKTAFKSICLIIVSLTLAVSVAALAGAVENSDTIELKNGDKIAGTLLTETYTVTSPYSVVTVEKNQISEIRINDEYRNHDVIELKAGGSVEGTIEETGFSFKPASGKIITLEKNQCKRIILKRNE
ncbi:hypothetical protein ACFL1N_04145 [Thermodesulfobacteriota bacterium]